MSPIIGVTCKTETAIEDYKNAVVEFGGEPRVLISRPGRTPEGSLRLTGFSCQGVVTLILAIMMSLGLTLTVLARLGALANRVMHWNCLSAKRHLSPIYLFSESAAGFR